MVTKSMLLLLHKYLVARSLYHSAFYVLQYLRGKAKRSDIRASVRLHFPEFKF